MTPAKDPAALDGMLRRHMEESRRVSAEQESVERERRKRRDFLLLQALLPSAVLVGTLMLLGAFGLFVALYIELPFFIIPWLIRCVRKIVSNIPLTNTSEKRTVIGILL